MIDFGPKGIYYAPDYRVGGFIDSLDGMGKDRTNIIIDAMGANTSGPYTPENELRRLQINWNANGKLIDPNASDEDTETAMETLDYWINHESGVTELEELCTRGIGQLTRAAGIIIENLNKPGFATEFEKLRRLLMNEKGNHFRIFEMLPGEPLKINNKTWDDSRVSGTVPLFAEWENPDPHQCEGCFFANRIIKGGQDGEVVICSQKRHRESDLRLRYEGLTPQEKVYIRFSAFSITALQQITGNFMQYAHCAKFSNFREARDGYVKPRLKPTVKTRF